MTGHSVLSLIIIINMDNIVTGATMLHSAAAEASLYKFTMIVLYVRDETTVMIPAIPDRPSCRVVSFGQNWKTGTGIQYSADIIGLS